MGRVLVVGSANYDLVFRCDRLPKPGETVLGSEFTTFIGGKGANQAVACARLGAETFFCGCIGDDAFGEEQRKSLRAAGVDLSYLKAVDTPTGTAAVLVGASGENQIVVAPGANMRLSPHSVIEAVQALEPDIVVAQLEIPLEAVEAAATAPRFLLNPAPAAPLPKSLLARCFAITPNEHEAERLSGVAGVEESAKALLDAGVAHVIITLGDRGSYYTDGLESLKSQPPSVIPVDTTAAGDTFTGALATALAEELGWPDALRFANAAAALSTTRHGAQASIPRRSEVEG